MNGKVNLGGGGRKDCLLFQRLKNKAAISECGIIQPRTILHTTQSREQRMAEQNLTNGYSIEKEDLVEGESEAWNAFLAFGLTYAVKAAMDLKIPDILAEGSPRGLTLDQICEALPTKSPNKACLFRLMRYLVHHKIFTQKLRGTEAEAVDLYCLNATSRCLLAENLARFGGAFFRDDRARDFFFNAWSNIGNRVAGQELSGHEVWDLAKQDPAWNRTFNMAMADISLSTMDTVLQHYHGFNNIKLLTDVGGNVGVQASKILQTYPHIQVICFDLPHVISVANQKTEGVTFVGGDMFETIPSADAIFMKSVLHDWDDEKCHQILRNCYRALPENGKVIIVDMVLDPSGRGHFGKMKMAFDLQMSVLSAGKERTEEEWHSLLHAAGFSSIKIHNMPSHLSLIEAFKM